MKDVEAHLSPCPADRSRASLLEALGRFADACVQLAQEEGPLPLAPSVTETARWLGQRILFICGAHRSGTTLSTQLLDGHQELGVLPSEGTYLTSLHSQVEALGPAPFRSEWIKRCVGPNLGPHFKLGLEPRPYVDLARAHAAFSRLVASDLGHGCLSPHTAMLLAWAYVSRSGDLEGLSWLVEKTPLNERHARTIAGHVRQARFLHVLRDPRWIFASQLRLIDRHPSVRLNRARILHNIRRSFSLAHENSLDLGATRYWVLKYEDLVADPEVSLTPIFRGLGVASLDPELLTPTEAGLPAPSNSSYQRVSGRVFRDSATGEPNLTNADLEVLLAWVGPRAPGRFGYVLPRLGPQRRAARGVQVLFDWLKGKARDAIARHHEPSRLL